jgi:DNA-directed RNA polymerase subunit beta'
MGLDGGQPYGDDLSQDLRDLEQLGGSQGDLADELIELDVPGPDER